MARKTKKTKGSVLIIDDQKHILTSLRTLFESEGYNVYTADDGDKGLLCIENLSPDIVLLDVWLPQIDGLALLEKIVAKNSAIPVIMMSGHAGIETAVRATKMGAVDFLEKPFTLDNVLRLVEKHVHKAVSPSLKNTPESRVKRVVTSSAPYQRSAKGLIRQATIEKSVVFNGFGLMSGRHLGMQLLPAPPGSGIRFIDIASNTDIPLHPDYLSGKSGDRTLVNSTALVSGKARARTIEHLLAALHMFRITNITVKIDEEIPNVDGSAIDFCRLIREAGVSQQREKTGELVIAKRMAFGEIKNSKAYMVITPYNGFAIDLRIDFPKPIGVQRYSFKFTSPRSFERDVAPARSFNTIENIDNAQKNGSVGSGMIGSHIIISRGKVINTELRFPNEFVRHKILDIIGDLYLLGRPIRGRIKANRTSHNFNHLVVKELAKVFGL
ncbi:MAG: UDP-3-O-[3-hydroxymyristoyl] N-acetylglucosamine deacetylase [Spirochaetes bacterium]|nr:UDP-3-O-[3-hydroxymyristoyl] N-acetylglucosamine deacetylase [Spirochaetota bacterium]